MVDGCGLVQPQPIPRDLACVVRSFAYLRFQQSRVGAKAFRCLLAWQAWCSLGLGMSDELFFRGKLRGGGISRGAWPGVDAAAVQLAAQRTGLRLPLRRLQADDIADGTRQGLIGQADEQIMTAADSDDRSVVPAG